jgi:hypothetical protein
VPEVQYFQKVADYKLPSLLIVVSTYSERPAGFEQASQPGRSAELKWDSRILRILSWPVQKASRYCKNRLP